MAKKPFFCDDCGTRNTPDSKYCKECGAPIHVAYQTQALTEYDRIDDPTDQERLTQFLDMAFWHNEAGNLDAAVRACNAALAINPNSTTAHSLLGSLYERQGNDAQAIEHFEQVLALNPDSPADRLKLVQLQEGLHIPPVRPSPVYRWLPPVLGTAPFSELAQSWRERWAELRSTERAPLAPKNPSLVVACAAALAVLTGAMFLLRPAAPHQTATSTVAAVVPAKRSAFGSAAAPVPYVSNPLPAPVVLPSLPGTPLNTRPSAIAAVPSHDPFSGTVPTQLTGSAMRVGAPHPVRSEGQSLAAGRLHPLPPLIAVPAAGSGPLPPASVSVPPALQASAAPASQAAFAPNADFARHTVVVTHLGDASAPADGESMSGGLSNGGASDQSSETAGPSRVQITVDPSPDSNSSTSAGSNSGSVPSSAASGSSASGEGFQQSAFTLQQQGDYQHAAAAYTQAIHAFQTQIAAGEDRTAAKRGLQACQTGLQICQQNR